MKNTVLILMMLLLSINFASASDDIDLPADLTQNEFDSFVKELGVSLSFNPMAPAEPLGITGFDVGVEVVLTDISDGDEYWKKVVEDNNPFSYIPVPRLHVQKGLPFDIDIGAMYVEVPSTNINLWGVELKYAILEGTVATPALSVRASYSKLDGVEDLDLDTLSLDVLISKGFLILTPYGGVSAIKINGSENTPDLNLTDFDDTIFRALVGLQISPFPLFVINGEVSFGEVVQYGLKVALRF